MATSAKSNKTSELPIEPLFDNVLIEPTDYEVKFKHGLVGVKPSSGEKPLVGIVRAIPSRSWWEKDIEIHPHPIVKVGDKVLYRKWSMSEIPDGTKELIVVGQKDIAGIIHEK